MDPSVLMDLLGFSTGEVERMTLILGRVSGLFLSAPFFSRNVGPMRIRALLLMLLTFVLYPMVEPWPGEGKGNMLAMTLAMVAEVVTGVAMGMMVHWALVTVQLAGNLIGFEMGLSMAQVMDPTSGVQENVISNLLYLGALMIFLAMDGHHLLLEGLVRSYRTLPLGHPPTPGALLETATVAVERFFLMGLLISAPVVVASKLLYLGMGLINRASPQVQVFFVAMPITQMMGFMILGLTMAIFGEVVIREIEAFSQLAFRLAGM